MNITEKSTKADIIDGACVLIDEQQEQLQAMQQQQRILWALVAVLTTLLVLS
jgi:hypothetical protein